MDEGGLTWMFVMEPEGDTILILMNGSGRDALGDRDSPAGLTEALGLGVGEADPEVTTGAWDAKACPVVLRKRVVENLVVDGN